MNEQLLDVIKKQNELIACQRLQNEVLQSTLRIETERTDLLAKIVQGGTYVHPDGLTPEQATMVKSIIRDLHETIHNLSGDQFDRDRALLEAPLADWGDE